MKVYIYIIDVLVPFTTKKSYRHAGMSSCREQESPKAEKTPSLTTHQVSYSKEP